MAGVTHLDINTEGDLSVDQRKEIINAIGDFVRLGSFPGVSFYINLEYIGGRPNDRS